MTSLFKLVCFILVMPLFLGACAMKNSSHVNTQPLQVVTTPETFSFASNQIPTGALNTLTQTIRDDARGPVTVTVAYALGTQPVDNQRVAAAQAKTISTYLTRSGVKNPIIAQLEPTGASAVNDVTIRFDRLQAKADPDCHAIHLADADNYTHVTDTEYRYGCSTDTAIAAQIADPSDLLGNDTRVAAESARQTKAFDTYRSGEPLTPPGSNPVSASTVYGE